jgi:hypothetical protein
MRGVLMHRTRSWPLLVLLLVVVAGGCGGGPTADPPISPTAPTPSLVSELDGTWEAKILRRAYLRYLADHGVRRADAVAAADVDHAGTDFSVQFLDGRFNVTGPTGESWHSGDFEVHGDELHLWDDGYRDAGFPPFRLLMEGGPDEVLFAIAPGQPKGPDHLPGIPELVAGGALWCPAPWRRVG